MISLPALCSSFTTGIFAGELYSNCGMYTTISNLQGMMAYSPDYGKTIEVTRDSNLEKELL